VKLHTTSCCAEFCMLAFTMEGEEKAMEENESKEIRRKVK
jgi:hypothetical protein